MPFIVTRMKRVLERCDRKKDCVAMGKSFGRALKPTSTKYRASHLLDEDDILEMREESSTSEQDWVMDDGAAMKEDDILQGKMGPPDGERHQNDTKKHVLKYNYAVTRASRKN